MVFAHTNKPTQISKQRPSAPSRNNSQRGRLGGGGNGPASDIRHSGEVGGTCERSPSVADGGTVADRPLATKLAPQFAQKRLPSGFSFPQFEQVVTGSLRRAGSPPSPVWRESYAARDVQPPRSSCRSESRQDRAQTGTYSPSALCRISIAPHPVLTSRDGVPSSGSCLRRVASLRPAPVATEHRGLLASLTDADSFSKPRSETRTR